MKRITVLVLALSFLLCLTGCSIFDREKEVSMVVYVEEGLCEL